MKVIKAYIRTCCLDQTVNALREKAHQGSLLSTFIRLATTLVLAFLSMKGISATNIMTSRAPKREVGSLKWA